MLGSRDPSVPQGKTQSVHQSDSKWLTDPYVVGVRHKPAVKVQLKLQKLSTAGKKPISNISLGNSPLTELYNEEV